MALITNRKFKRLDSFLKPIMTNLTPFLTVLLIFCICIPAEGQVRLQDPAEKETPFIDQLWFGGNVNLGFQGTNRYNVFFFGVSPMVGYKFNEDFSAGPRFEIMYTYYKAFVQSEGRNLTAQPIDFSYGVFARHKIFNQFFGHVEYNRERATYLITGQSGNFISQNGKLATATFDVDNLYIGIGYFSGGGSKWGSEISLLFNLLEDDQSLTLPFSIRVGINYNF